MMHNPNRGPIHPVTVEDKIYAPRKITPGSSLISQQLKANEVSEEPATGEHPDGADECLERPKRTRLIDFCTKYRRKRVKKIPEQTTEKDKNNVSKNKLEKAEAGRNAMFSIDTNASNTPGDSIKVRFENGRMIIDEESVVIGDQRPQETVKYTEIEESTNPTATSRSFTNHTQHERWSKEDTKMFYKCLQRCGTDFTIMEEQFQFARTRKELKRKFNVEEKKNPDLVNKALVSIVPMDMTDYNERQLKAAEEAKKVANKKGRKIAVREITDTAAETADYQTNISNLQPESGKYKEI